MPRRPAKRRQDHPHRRGIPPNETPEERQALLEALIKYIRETPMPNLTRFASDHETYKQHLQDLAEAWPEWDRAMLWAMTKKEAYLEEEALHFKVNAGVAIMSLKANHGWKDGRETQPVQVNGVQAMKEMAEAIERADTHD